MSCEQQIICSEGEGAICEERCRTLLFLSTRRSGRRARSFKSSAKLPEVEKALLVYGVYDLVANLQAHTMEKLEDAITLKIRRIAGIRSTLTLIVSRQCK